MISRSTYGVIFLGTPHRGSVQPGLGTPVADVCRVMLHDGNAGILGSRGHSLALLEGVWERIWERFEGMLVDGKVKAYSFVEGIPNVGAGMVRVLCIHFFAQILIMVNRGLVVKQVFDSGHIGSSLNRMPMGFIDATHQDMCKFGSRMDSGYKSVVRVVENFVAEATAAAMI